MTYNFRFYPTTYLCLYEVHCLWVSEFLWFVVVYWNYNVLRLFSVCAIETTDNRQLLSIVPPDHDDLFHHNQFSGLSRLIVRRSRPIVALQIRFLEQQESTCMKLVLQVHDPLPRLPSTWNSVKIGQDITHSEHLCNKTWLVATSCPHLCSYLRRARRGSLTPCWRWL